MKNEKFEILCLEICKWDVSVQGGNESCKKIHLSVIRKSSGVLRFASDAL